MPFQDIDEVSTSEPRRPPGRAEKVVRKLFVEDWSLKLLSLAITLVIWVVVTGQNQPVTTHVNVQLNFIRPQSLEISNDPPKTIDVMLTGSRSKLDNLSSLDLVATVDISDQRQGERILRLADKAQIVLPHGVKVDGFQPSAIPIRLEPIMEKLIEIEPKLEGKPADGYEVYAVRPSKGAVVVRGVASHVGSLQKAATETIWLVGHKESFTASNVAIDVADPKIDLLEPVVNVDIEIGERRLEKTFSGVPVSAPQGVKVRPGTTTVTVLGTVKNIETLKLSDLRIILDGSLAPRLEVSPAFQGKVTLKSVTPSTFESQK